MFPCSVSALPSPSLAPDYTDVILGVNAFCGVHGGYGESSGVLIPTRARSVVSSVKKTSQLQKIIDFRFVKVI
jgi:hypothetical protein